MGDVLGKILDRDASLDPPHIRLGEHELIERNVARRRQLDLLNGLCHVSFSGTSGQETLSRPPTRSRSEAPPSCSKRAAPRRRQKGETRESEAGDAGNWHPR